MKRLIIILFILISINSVGQNLRGYKIEAIKQLQAHDKFILDQDSVTATTQINDNDTTLLTLGYLNSIKATRLDAATGLDTLKYMTPGNVALFTELNYVPYTGSRDNLYMDTFNIQANRADLQVMRLDTGYVSDDNEVTGDSYWDIDNFTYTDILENGVIGQRFQEDFFIVKNETGSIITDGTPVMYAGSVGASGKPKVVKAIADGSIIAGYIMGIATQEIAINGWGYVTWRGNVRGINTTGTPYGETWAAGDIIYVSPYTAGYLTNIPPEAPYVRIMVALVNVVGTGNGTLLARPNWATNITDASDVNGTPLTTSGQFMVWNNTNGYFDFDYDISDYITFSDTSTTIGTKYDLTQINVSDLVEVAASSPSTNDVIKFDGANWIVGSQTSSGGAGSGYISEIDVVGGGISPLYDIYQDSILRAKTIKSLSNDISVSNGSTSVDFTFNPSNVLLTQFDSASFRITENQISDLTHFVNADETDQIYANDSNYIKNHVRIDLDIDTTNELQTLTIDSLDRVFTIGISDVNSIKFEDTNTTYDLSQYQQDSDTTTFDGTKYDDRFGNAAFDSISELRTDINTNTTKIDSFITVADVATVLDAVTGIVTDKRITPNVFSTAFAVLYENTDKEIPSGLINGINDTYTVSRNFIAYTTEVFKNGVEQTINVHYTELINGIVMNPDYLLDTGDIIEIKYRY